MPNCNTSGMRPYTYQKRPSACSPSTSRGCPSAASQPCMSDVPHPCRTESSRPCAAEMSRPCAVQTSHSCGTAAGAAFSDFPIAMAYVPWQHFSTTYELDKALSVGTIFPELDKPFLGKRGCRL